MGAVPGMLQVWNRALVPATAVAGTGGGAAGACPCGAHVVVAWGAGGPGVGRRFCERCADPPASASSIGSKRLTTIQPQPSCAERDCATWHLHAGARRRTSWPDNGSTVAVAIGTPRLGMTSGPRPGITGAFRSRVRARAARRDTRRSNGHRGASALPGRDSAIGSGCRCENRFPATRRRRSLRHRRRRRVLSRGVRELAPSGGSGRRGLVWEPGETLWLLAVDGAWCPRPPV